MGKYLVKIQIVGDIEIDIWIARDGKRRSGKGGTFHEW